MVSPICWWCPLETSFVLLVCACNLCCAQCTHCLSRYTEQGVNAWEREQQQFLAQNKYFGLKHPLPRNHLSSQHWPCICHWAARNHAMSTERCFPCLSQVNHQALKKTQWSCQCLEPVTKDPFCPTHSLCRAFEVTQRVCGCGVLTYREKEPCETLKSHLLTKNPMKHTHFPFEILCRRWPFLVFTKHFFLQKTAHLSSTTFSFSGQWSLPSLTVSCLSGPP